MQQVLAEEREILSENQADTAVFYSISNCQRGLRGISFGNSLIKQVVEDLSRDLPQLNTFVTLSPIPGLNRWLQGLRDEQPDSAVAEILSAVDHAEKSGDTVSLDHYGPELRFLATQYLVEQKRPNGMPLDPVARFHLGNGALIHDVHALADISPNGLQQSSGVMVNYLYDLSKVEQNHEEFATDQTVAQSRTIQSVLRAGFPDRKTRKTANG